MAKQLEAWFELKIKKKYLIIVEYFANLFANSHKKHLEFGKFLEKIQSLTALGRDLANNSNMYFI